MRTISRNIEGLKSMIRLCGFILIIALASCSKKDSTPVDPFDPSTSKKITNHAYGPGSFQKADIYLPANRSAVTKTMILVHGGFWSGGDKADMDTLIAPIQAEDPSMAIININYTLADGNPANQHPAQMNDFKRLLDFVDSIGPTWHIGKNYAFTGVSSGAHLSLLYGYAYDNAHRVRAIASVIGPTNFSDPFYSQNFLFQQVVSAYLGKTWTQDSTLHKNVSPALIVKAGAPATFMAYGGMDQLVPLSNPELLKNKLIALGVPNSYTVYPNEQHEMSATAIKDIIVKMHSFFVQYL